MDDELNYRCRQCGKPIFDEAAARHHMERLETHTVDALLPALMPESGDPS